MSVVQQLCSYRVSVKEELQKAVEAPYLLISLSALRSALRMLRCC